MPAPPRECANDRISLGICPCTSESCGNRGICCECIQAQHVGGSPTACMGGALRKPETMSLSQRAQADCPTNRARNAEFCVRTYDSCGHQGVCRDCVRNHFTLDGTGRTACLA